MRPKTKIRISITPLEMNSTKVNHTGNNSSQELKRQASLSIPGHHPPFQELSHGPALVWRDQRVRMPALKRRRISSNLPKSSVRLWRSQLPRAPSGMPQIPTQLRSNWRLPKASTPVAKKRSKSLTDQSTTWAEQIGRNPGVHRRKETRPLIPCHPR